MIEEENSTESTKNTKMSKMPNTPKDSKNKTEVEEKLASEGAQEVSSDSKIESPELEIVPETEAEDELEKSKKLALENYERFMRVSADFENLRKRSEKERVDLMRFGNESLFKDLLPVFDSFQKAIPDENAEIATEGGESTEFTKGIVLILKQLADVLKKNGLKEIESAGEKFDPNFHQAIQRIDSENVTEETVQDEFVKGYLLHDRLIRPAMVSVLVPISTPES